MTAARPVPPSALRIGGARAGLELRLFFRDRAQVAFSFAYPIVMMVIFGSVLPGARHPHLDGARPARARPTASARHPGGRVLRRQRRAGARHGDIQLTVLLVVARYGYDVPLPVDAAHWLTFIWVAAFGALAGTVLGIAASLLPHRSDAADTQIAVIALILQLFSGVFFVYSKLPAWMRDTAEVFPLKWMTQGMRSAVLPDAAKRAEVSGSWQHGWTAIVLALWIVLGVVVCARRFRWRRLG